MSPGVPSATGIHSDRESLSASTFSTQADAIVTAGETVWGGIFGAGN